MTDMTAAYLDKLESHDDGDVRGTALALKVRLAALESETDADKKAALEEELHDLKAVLEYELLEGGRAGEDYINDGEFHAAR